MRTAVCVALLLFVGVCAVRAESPGLSGTWAMVQVYPQIAKLPIAGEVRRSSTVAQFADVTQDGEVLTLIDRYCFTDVDDGTPLVNTVIPSEFMASLRPTPRTAVLRETEEGVLFEGAPYLEVRGAVLADPAADPLPIEPDDPRVIDQDGDGNTGMTVRMTILGIVEGETYVVQRVTYRLTGWLVAPDRIEGWIDWTDEQTVLEATNPLLEVDTIGAPDPDPSAHRFVMVRVDPTWTCETLRERLSERLSEILGEG